MHIVNRAQENDLTNQTFISDFHVRWNTTYDMIERFSEFKGIIDEITYTPRAVEGLNEKKREELRKLALNEEDWKRVQSLIKLLKPFKRVTDLLQGQKYQTLSLSKVAEQMLFKYYKNVQEQHSSVNERFVADQILDYLEKYLVILIIRSIKAS